METDPGPGVKRGPAHRQLRVLIAESNAMYCGLIRSAFEALDCRFRVVGSASSTVDLTTAVAKSRPEVAVISVNLQEGNLAGLQVLPRVQAISPATRSILVLESSSRELVIEAFRLGADGVFCRNQSFELLCRCVEAVSGGQIWANAKELRYVLDAFVQSSKQRRIAPKAQRHMTKSEAAVVSLAVSGLPNRDIAAQLGLTEHTVKNYLYRVFNKLGVSNRVELVLSCLHQEDANRDPAAGRSMEVELHSAE